jgi:uncharacterized protein YigA (DUF484 family)
MKYIQQENYFFLRTYAVVARFAIIHASDAASITSRRIKACRNKTQIKLANQKKV